MRVLLLVHGFPPRAEGGTEIYTEALARALVRQGAEVEVFAREADPASPEHALSSERRDGFALTLINHTFAGARGLADTYRSAGVRAALAAVLARFRPDVLHVQHLTCLSTDVIAEAKLQKVPVVFTLNDYWLMCQRGQLLDLDYRRCDGPSPLGCARCLGPAAAGGRFAYRAGRALASLEHRLPRLKLAAAGFSLHARLRSGADGENAVAERLAHVREMCALVDRFLVPSRTLAERFRAFGLDPARMEPIEQGIDLEAFARLGRTATSSPRLRIGFAGSLLRSKAPHLLLEAFARLPEGRAELHLWGAFAAYHGDDSYRHLLAPLLGGPGVHHHGAIAHAQVAAAMAGLDLLVVPSTWIENAPFVIREAFAAGLPVVAADLGGMAEMVRDGVDGVLFPPDDAALLAATLRRLLDRPADLERLRAGVRPPRSIDDEARETLRLYSSLTGRSAPDPSPSRGPSLFHAPDRSLSPSSSSPSPSRNPDPSRAPALAALPAPAAAPAAGSPPGRPRLAAVVLNYRTPADAELCLRSLATSTWPPDDIVVVDNASGDGSAERLRARAPAVAVLTAETNLGYPGGMNLGIRAALAAGAERLLLLNADVVLGRDCIARLMAALGREPGAAVTRERD